MLGFRTRQTWNCLKFGLKNTKESSGSRLDQELWKYPGRRQWQIPSELLPRKLHEHSLKSSRIEHDSKQAFFITLLISFFRNCNCKYLPYVRHLGGLQLIYKWSLPPLLYVPNFTWDLMPNFLGSLWHSLSSSFLVLYYSFVYICVLPLFLALQILPDCKTTRFTKPNAST